MKLFSLGRTDLAVSSKLPTPVGIANCRRTIIVLRTSVMVRYTWRSPWTVVFAHCVQSWCDARPASPRILIIWMISYSSCFDGTDNSKNDGDTYISHPMRHLPRFLRKVFIFLSFLQIASEQLPGIDTWYKQFNYPTTHPAYRAPRHEKVNFS
jgi:hypothetical protein